MTTLDFNSVEKVKFKQNGVDRARARLESVLKAVVNYGVEPKYIFTVEDILKKKNTPKVIRCLEQIAKIVSMLWITTYSDCTQYLILILHL